MAEWVSARTLTHANSSLTPLFGELDRKKSFVYLILSKISSVIVCTTLDCDSWPAQDLDSVNNILRLRAAKDCLFAMRALVIVNLDHIQTKMRGRRLILMSQCNRWITLSKSI